MSIGALLKPQLTNFWAQNLTGRCVRAVACCLCIVSYAASSKESVNYVFGDYQSAPYVYYSQKEKQNKGIMLDISSELGRRIPIQINHMNLPRKRTEQFLLKGNADVRCHLSPFWVQHPEQLVWTEPLYSLNTVVITHVDFDQTIYDIEPLKGLVLGTIHGYRYSQEITELLDFLEAMHIETPSLEYALQMLSKKRVEAVVGNHILANYLMAQLDLQQHLKIHPYVVRKQDIHCALSKKSSVDTALIIHALHTMKQDGSFEKILSHYFEPVDLANLH